MTTSQRSLASLTALLDRPDVGRAHDVARQAGGIGALLGSSRGALEALGLSSAEIARVRAIVHLTRGPRAPRPRPLTTPARVAALFPHLTWIPHEELWVVPVDTSLRRLDLVMVARGASSSCAATPSELLGPAIRTRAHGLFLVHNHPSGDPRPSETDRAFTRRLVDACQLLSLRLEDHIVIAGGRWTSVIRMRSGKLPAERDARSRARASGLGAIHRPGELSVET